MSLSAQQLWLYKDGQCILESYFVSGNPTRGHATPKGIYGLTYKTRDAVLSGEGYDSKVKYWMPFNRNVGLHDAPGARPSAARSTSRAAPTAASTCPPPTPPLSIGMSTRTLRSSFIEIKSLLRARRRGTASAVEEVHEP